MLHKNLKANCVSKLIRYIELNKNILKIACRSIDNEYT